MKIKGKIIRIIDKRTVIVNLGKEQGISSSSVFYILGDPEEILDPETGEVLGSVNVTKSRVKASQVFEKFTIATTSWTRTYANANIYSSIIATSSIFGTKTEEIDEGELNIIDSELKPWKARSEVPVRVGDVVEVKIEENEEEPETVDDNAESTKEITGKVEHDEIPAETDTPNDSTS